MRARLGALALYGTATVALTWPLCLHLSTHVLDDGTLDAFQYVWNLWWTRHALLDLHTNPFTTRVLFFPEGVSLFWHTLSFTTGLLSTPFALLGPGMTAAVLAQNAVNLLALPATAVLTALLAHDLTGRRAVAVVSGLLPVASPFYVQQLHIAHLSTLYWLVAVLVLWRRLHLQRSWRVAAAMAATAVLLFFASQDYAVMALALCGYDLLYRALRKRAEREALWSVGALAAVGLALVLVGGAALTLGTRAAPEPPPFRLVVWNSAYLTGFVTPPWAARGAQPFFASSLYLGIAPFVLALVAQVIVPRQATRWNLATLLCLLAALGPALQFTAPPPGAYGDPSREPRVWPGWPLPYRLAYDLIPGVAMGRGPWRWMGPARVCLAMAAACGMAEVARRLEGAGARGRWLGIAGGLVVAGVSLAEALPHRLGLARATAPSGYEVVRADPGGGAVLDLPSGLRRLSLGLYSSLYMAYQTEHRHPLVEGTVARLPATQRYVFQRRDFRLVEHPEIAYVVLHRPLFRRVYPVAPSIRLAREARREGELVFRDAELRVYRLRSSPRH